MRPYRLWAKLKFMKDKRFEILQKSLQQSGIHPAEIDACLDELIGELDEKKLGRFLEVLQERDLLSADRVRELHRALDISDEACAVFFQAHLNHKPVVLLLKGLEELLKNIEQSEESQGRKQEPKVTETPSRIIFQKRMPPTQAAQETAPVPDSLDEAGKPDIEKSEGDEYTEIEPAMHSESEPAAPELSQPDEEEQNAEPEQTTPQAESPIEALPTEETLDGDEESSDDDGGPATEFVEAVEPPSPIRAGLVSVIQESSPYQIIGLLGQGRFSQTYKAREKASGDSVTLKFFPQEWRKKKELTDLLFAVARQAISLEHPHLARINQIVLSDADCYAVGEYVEGLSLKNFLTAGTPLTPQRALVWFDQLLGGLKTIHDADLCHGSIHPGNIIVQPTGEVKLLDLGLAALEKEDTGFEPDEDLLNFLATYRAPEHQGSATDPSPASDIYELGVVFYHMVTGRPPFVSEEREALAREHASEDLPSLPPSLLPLTDTLGALLEKMTVKNASDRTTDIPAILEEVERIKKELPSKMANVDKDETGLLTFGTASSTVQPAPLLRKRLRRSPTPGGTVQNVIMLAVICIVLGAVYFLKRTDKPQSKELEALTQNLSYHGQEDFDNAQKLAAHGESAIPFLEQIFHKGSVEKQVPAVKTLALIIIKKPAARPAARALLVKLLDHKNPAVRGESLLALANFGGKDLLSHFEKVTKDSEPEARRMAMIALRDYGGEEALQLVKKGLEDQDISVRQQAEISLESLTRSQ